LESFGRLGVGERAVLTLAMSIPASVAIIDDLPARRVAESFGVTVTGTLHVILVAKQRGLVPAVRPLLDRLHDVRFRMSADLRDGILTLADEG
jgi:predicted nucleic acid-binding protein